MQPVGVASEHAAKSRSRRARADPTAIDGDRVISFSDNVFAFAATLLVLSINVPSSASGLGSALIEEGPNLFAYALSFLILGNFWIDHHKLFGRLTGVDGRTLWLSLVYLALIALVPFSCELIGEHGDTSIGVSVYAVNIVLVTVVFGFLCRHAIKIGAISGGEEGAEVIDQTAFGGFVLAAIFAASVPLAIFVSPNVATLSYLLIIAAMPLSMRTRERVRSKRA